MENAIIIICITFIVVLFLIYMPSIPAPRCTQGRSKGSEHQLKLAVIREIIKNYPPINNVQLREVFTKINHLMGWASNDPKPWETVQALIIEARKK